jgi:flavin reductase (DIM6/NTAB) family NADH-FMN oxidoreductase RutF
MAIRNGNRMNLDPRTFDQRELYKIIIGCIVPRPIAWVSTVDREGRHNLAPFSFFNGIGSNPPAVSVSINYTEHNDQRKDTLRNIQSTGEFVVNIVDEMLAEAMNETATDYPPDVDEFTVAGLTPAPSVTVRAPRVAEAPVSLECALFTCVPVGDGAGSSTLVIGTITHFVIRDDIIDERHRIDVHKLRPIARLAGSSYAYVHETFELTRRRYNRETGQLEPAS